LYILHMSFFCF